MRVEGLGFPPIRPRTANGWGTQSELNVDFSWSEDAELGQSAQELVWSYGQARTRTSALQSGVALNSWFPAPLVSWSLIEKLFHSPGPVPGPLVPS